MFIINLNVYKNNNNSNKKNNILGLIFFTFKINIFY